MNRRSPAALVALCLLAVPAARARGGDVTFLPDTSVSLRASRFLNPDPDFQEDGWIGAGAGIVRVDGATAYFSANFETVIGNVIRTIDPNQANYHLEAGVDRPFGDGRRLNLFFHHVSRHLIDRFKTDTVDWNVLGVRGETKLGFVPGTLSASLGHTTRVSLVGYEWELIARAHGDLFFGGRPEGPYYDGGIRFVTTTSNPAYPRSSFADVLAEGGWRWRRGDRTLDLFLAYQRVNDAPILSPGVRGSALFGLHIGSGPSREPWYWR
jgi:hypothetical protein